MTRHLGMAVLLGQRTIPFLTEIQRLLPCECEMRVSEIHWSGLVGGTFGGTTDLVTWRAPGP